MVAKRQLLVHCIGRAPMINDGIPALSERCSVERQANVEGHSEMVYIYCSRSWTIGPQMEPVLRGPQTMDPAEVRD